jgi:hypothetical protein
MGLHFSRHKYRRLERLARLVAGSQEGFTCEQCRERLLDYVSAETEGQEADQLYPEVRQHLETCLTCQQVYAEQLKIARLEATDALPQLSQEPRLNLGFLPPHRPDLARLVYESTAAMLRLVKSVHLDELELLRDRLLERLNDLANQTNQPGQLGTFAVALGFTEPVPAVQWAVATLIAMQTLRARSNVEEIKRLKASGKLTQFLSSVAQDAARQGELGHQERNKFVSAFVHAHSQERWEQLVEWMTYDRGRP